MPPDTDEPSPVIDEVEQLLAKVTQAPDQDYRGALERICREHPQHAQALRRRFSLAQKMGLLEALARPAARSSPVGPSQDFGDFQLLEKIGGGGMGVVWLARQKTLGRLVALKLIRCDLGLTGHSRERFRREALAVSRLDHPGICPLLEAGEFDGAPYLAMRYVPGETLAAKLAQARRESTPKPAADKRGSTSSASNRRRTEYFTEIVEAIAWALDSVHRAGLVHRDIKPANIMIADGDRPLILDFGLALFQTEELQHLTLSGDVVGTPVYLSPEQVAPGKRRVDHRADIYALGVTLYECLTLRLPFAETTREALYRSILSAEVRNPRRVNRHIPRDLVVVLQKAMERSPERRYATAHEFAEDLRRVRLHEPVHARRVGPLVRLGHWTKRRPTLATALLAGILLPIVGLATSLVMLTRVDAARLEEQNQRRRAESALASAFLEKADRANADGDHAAAAIFAAAALLNDPDNPHGPHHDLILGQTESREASERMALMNSALFEAEASRRVEFMRALELLQTLNGAQPRIGRRPVYSPDGREIAVAVEDGSVAIWSVTREGAPRFLKPPRACNLLQLDHARDGGALAGRTKDAILFWDPRAGVLIGELALGPGSRCFAYAPDSVHVAVGYRSGVVRVWRVADRALAFELALESGDLNAIAYSPDGTQLAAVDMKQAASLWSLAERRRIASRDLTQWATDVAFAPDGSAFAVAALDNLLWVFSAADATELHRIETGDRPGTLGFAPDSSALVHGGIFTTAAIRSSTDFSVLDVIHGSHESTSEVSFSPDGKTIATGGTGWSTRVWLWRVRDPDLTVRRRAHQKVFASVAISRDGRQLVTTGPDRSLVLWSLSANGDFRRATQRRYEYRSHLAATIKDARISPDGQVLAASPHPGEVELRSLPDGDIMTVLHDSRPANDHGCPLAFSPDGTLCFGGGADGSILRWSLSAGAFAPSLVGHKAAVLGLAVSPDGRLIASASEDATVRVWHAETAEPALVLGGHDGLVSGVAFAPDGRELASAGVDAKIRVWDTQTGALSRTLEGHGMWVNDIAYSPDGRLLLSGSDDNTARLWDMQTGRVLQVFRGAEQVIGLCFSPDGRFFYMNDGLDLTRHTVDVFERVKDPRQLLRLAEQAAGARLSGLELVPSAR